MDVLFRTILVPNSIKILNTFFFYFRLNQRTRFLLLLDNLTIHNSLFNFWQLGYYYSITSVLFSFMSKLCCSYIMIVNELNKKVKGKYYKEITIEDDGDSIAYIFPNTEEFIKILKRRSIKKNIKSK